jgi:hypothetical protein
VTFNDKSVFRPLLEEQLKVQIEKRVASVIIDTGATTGVLAQEDQEWIIKDFFPRVAKTATKALITVVPKSALTNLANKRWQSVGNAFGFEMYNVGSAADAEELARKIKDGASIAA